MDCLLNNLQLPKYLLWASNQMYALAKSDKSSICQVNFNWLLFGNCVRWAAIGGGGGVSRVEFMYCQYVFVGSHKALQLHPTAQRGSF